MVCVHTHSREYEYEIVCVLTINFEDSILVSYATNKLCPIFVFVIL